MIGNYFQRFHIVAMVNNFANFSDGLILKMVCKLFLYLNSLKMRRRKMKQKKIKKEERKKYDTELLQHA